MKILMNMPDPEKEGGVAQYCNALKPFFQNDIDYLVVGSRSDSKSSHRSFFRVLIDYVQFFKKMRAGKYDMVHLNPSLGSKAIIRDGIFLLITKAFGKKVVVFNHGWDENFEQLIRRYFPSLFRMVFSRVDAFVVLASGFRSKLNEMGYNKPVFVETTAVDDGLFKHGGDAVAVRKSKTESKKFTVLFLSRVEMGKGVYESLDAFQMLKERHPYATMIFAGDGSELARLREYAAGRNMTDIEFTGYVSGAAKNDVFSHADVYLFPSWSEGMPISVLEAMTFGLAVVTRPVGGIPDFFEDGKMGFLTESRNPAVLARLLEQLIENPELRLTMGDYNHHYAQEHFRPAKVAGRLEDIYRSVLTCEVT